MKKILALIVLYGFTQSYYPIGILPYFTDTLDIRSYNYSNSTQDSSVWISIDYPQIVNTENNVIITKINSYLKDEFMQSVSWYEELASDTTMSDYTPADVQYTFDTGFQVMYNSTGFISIILNHFQYTGGAHGNYFASGYNIRLRDGENLTLKNMITEGSLDILSYECEQAIMENYKANSLIEAGLFEDELMLTDDQDYYIIPGALVIQFDPYEVGPYAMGEIIAEIPFEKISDILQSKLPFVIK